MLSAISIKIKGCYDSAVPIYRDSSILNLLFVCLFAITISRKIQWRLQLKNSYSKYIFKI